MFYSLFVLFTNLKYPSLLGTWWMSIYIQNILMPDVFTVNLEQISQTGLLFPLLTLNKYMPASLLYQELVIQSAAFEMTWNHTRNKKKNNTLLEVISNPRIYMFLEDFTTTNWKLTEPQFLATERSLKTTVAKMS